MAPLGVGLFRFLFQHSDQRPWRVHHPARLLFSEKPSAQWKNSPRNWPWFTTSSAPVARPTFTLHLSRYRSPVSFLCGKKSGCPFKAITRDRHDTGIPVADESVDVLFAFYSLEHVVDLQDHIKEMLRVLRPGGFLVGAVPNEGGLAWGLARYLGTRKWIRNKYNINYDKIIAWEHPNYVDFVQETLNKHFSKDLWRSHPLPFVKSFNLNLISSFVYSKSA